LKPFARGRTSIEYFTFIPVEGIAQDIHNIIFRERMFSFIPKNVIQCKYINREHFSGYRDLQAKILKG